MLDGQTNPQHARLSPMIPNQVSVFIGSPVEHGSERSVLLELLRLLEMSGEKATILVNININGRQLDLVLGTDNLTLVLEAKACAIPLSGTTNGPWAAHTRSGRSRITGNAYSQALGQKYALCSALRDFMGHVDGYPNAHVVFVPELAAGSNLSFDFKVTYGGINGLALELERRSELRCTSNQWHAFAIQHNLERVFDLASALDARSLDAQRTIDRYIAAFTNTYLHPTTAYKPDVYEVDGEPADLSFVEHLLLDARTDLIIKGPSGCGKSLLSIVLANRLHLKNFVPIILEGKLFEGQLGPALDREAALLEVTSAKKLLSAARILARPIIIIADGYNECPSSLRFNLTRALRAASIMYDAAIIVSSQIDIERPDLLSLRKIVASAPSHELKVEIASLNQPSAELLAPLLQTITSGIEASLLGQMGREVDRVTSKSALFDCFVRQCLGGSASEGITILCCIAELLLERTTFSLSRREADRILVTEKIGAEVLQKLIRARVLVVRGERFSFAHEMYLNAFAAESVVRRTHSNFEELAQALASPRLSELRTFIMGAIEDQNLLAKLIYSTADSQLLKSIIKGECGREAKRLVMQGLNTAICKLRHEVEATRFFIAPDELWQVGVEPTSCTNWTENERAMLSALPTALALDHYAQTLLDVFRLLDQTLTAERERLQSEALEKGFKNLRSGLFAAAYIFGQRNLGITLVTSILHSGGIEPSWRQAELQASLRTIWLNVSTPGQFYFALASSTNAYQLEDENLKLAIDRILPLFEVERWKKLPYHVHLDLMHFVRFLPQDDLAKREELSKKLESLLPVLNPLLAGTAIEALSNLGGLQNETSEHETGVRLQVAEVLSSPCTEGAENIAWEIYNGQFDHPFSAIYADVFDSLSEEQRLILMRLACVGASEDSFFLGTLIDKLADAGDLSAAPAISRWARLPDPFTPVRQTAIEIYLSALTALGRLRADLPIDSCPTGLGASEDTLSACGMIYYWLQRSGAEVAEAEPSIAAALNTLYANPSCAIGVLYEISHSVIGENPRSIALITAFPTHSIMIARAALQQAGSMEGYFQGPHFFGRRGGERFAISIIGSYGEPEDLPLLRSFVDQVDLSASAREALIAIETRSSVAPQASH